MAHLAVAGMAWTDIAREAYKAYAAVTDNKNFRGDPMPEFDALPLTIQTAWEAAVRHAANVNECFVQRIEAPDPSVWNGWTRP